MKLRYLLPLAAVAAAVIAPTAAHAHLGVETSEPAHASVVEQAPDVAVITFDAAVDVDTAEAQLRHLGDLDTPLSEATRRDVKTEALELLTGEGRTATFDLPELPAGLYAIDWAVNEAGGHDNSSFILFKVTGSEESSVVLYVAIVVAVLIVGGALFVLRSRSK